MNTLKSTASRSLQSNFIAQHTQFSTMAARGITETTRNATSIDTTLKSPRSTPFLPQEFRLTTPSITPPLASSANAFTTLLNAITTSLTTRPTAALPHLTRLLRSYASDPADWSRYAHSNASKQYTRNLVCEVPGVFNLLLLVWTPGKRSPVHDHADAHCLMKVLKGSLVERRFEIPDGKGKGEMRESMRNDYGVEKVSYMSDQLGLHEISNPSPMEYAVSLHLYTPPNAAIRGCHIYDLENGEAKHVMQGVYDSINGVPT